jgi:hypothetical protein
VWNVLNFEWILLLKIQTNYKKRVSKGKCIECVHTWGQQHMLPYLSMKEGSLLCFVIVIFPKPRCLGLWYGTYHQKVFNKWGALIWFIMFGATMWNLLIIEPFFHWIFWKAKIENYIGIWGHSWYCWKTFTKFDFIKLIL